MKTLTILLLAIIFAIPAHSQEFKFIRAEAYYGYGYTAFDIDTWVGSTLLNWDQANYGPQIQVFFFKYKAITAGVQIGYQTLFWYETRRDAGFGTPIFRNFYPGATQIMLIGQTGGETGFFSEFGIGGYSGESIGGLALALGAGYRIGLQGGWAIPVKIRVDPLFAEQTFVVTSLNVGATYQIREKRRSGDQ